MWCSSYFYHQPKQGKPNNKLVSPRPGVCSPQSDTNLESAATRFVYKLGSAVASVIWSIQQNHFKTNLAWSATNKLGSAIASVIWSIQQNHEGAKLGINWVPHNYTFISLLLATLAVRSQTRTLNQRRLGSYKNWALQLLRSPDPFNKAISK